MRDKAWRFRFRQFLQSLRRPHRTNGAAGIHLGWKTQLMMVLSLMLTSKGLAGVPRAMLVVLVATAQTFHLPTEPIFMILGVDAFIDMGRAALNVTGNCLACAVIARWEGQLVITSQSVVPSLPSN
jgi:proton glutamate symport protein